MDILQEEEKLLEIVQLVGSDALPEKQQLTLEVARIIREYFLQQNAFHEVDTFCQLEKTYLLMDTILHFSKVANNALEEGVGIETILVTDAKDKIAEVKFVKDYKKELAKIRSQMDREFDKL